MRFLPRLKKFRSKITPEQNAPHQPYPESTPAGATSTVSVPTATLAPSSSIPGPSTPRDLDTTNVMLRYERAREKLQVSLKAARNEWGSFDFAVLSAIPEDDVARLQGEINKVLDARKEAKDNPTKWRMCKGIVENVFTAMSPFAKNFLSVTKDAAQVLLISFGL
jgi:hypothetical protein